MTIKSLSSSQIALIIKKGKAYNSGSFLLKVFENSNSLSDNRQKTDKTVFLGSFISSKKVFDKSVDRNRTKRILKEAFLEAVRKIEKKGLIMSIPQFIFLTKKDTIKNTFANIVEEIEQILIKDYIIKQ